MNCVIYRSTRRDQTYLFIEKMDDFSRVPDELMQSLGKLIFVMPLVLNPQRTLARADPERVKAILQAEGYYLQLPPQEESLLKQPLSASQ
ncbi:MAG: Protein YcgL [Candidatus Erwinia impunctatus]|nr:Protein YcgL [Culicoides impunctatus]